jgi:hypothetical protein
LVNNRCLSLCLVFSVGLACGSSGKSKDARGIDGPTDAAVLDMTATDTPDATPVASDVGAGDMADAGAAEVAAEVGSGDASGVTTKVAQFTSSIRACGLAYADATSTIWVFPCSSPMAHAFTTAGVAMGTLPLQGESADDGDLDVAPRAFMLGTTAVPAGSLLFTNGEAGTAEIYAYDPATKMPLGMLATMFGDNHVVGASFHSTRGSFFAVQDRQTSAGNRVAEIEVSTGAVAANFPTIPAVVVNYGDVEVCQPTGNLLVVSSDRTDLGEFTPAGAFVRYHDLPADVTGLSGIGIDDATGDLWVTGTGGTVWKVNGTPCPPRT